MADPRRRQTRRRAPLVVARLLALLLVTVLVSVAPQAGFATSARAAAQAQGQGQGPGQGPGQGGAASLSDRLADDARDDDLSVGSGSVALEGPLADLVTRIARTDQHWAIIVVDEEPPNAKVLANEVLARLRALGSEQSTVVVLTPSSVGAESRTYSVAIDDALRDALPTIERDPVAGIAAIFQALTGDTLGDVAQLRGGPSSSGGGGRSGGTVVVVVAAVVAVAATLVVGLRRSRETG